MPVYNYGPCTNEECEGHEQTYQHNKKMSEYKDPQACPFCGEMHERAMNDFSSAPPILSGCGWARDGYNMSYKPVSNVYRNPTSKK